MKCKRIVFFLSVTLVACLCYFGLPVNNSIDLKMPSWLSQDATNSTLEIQIPEWMIIQEALASPYRRSVRRTSRRTARRVSHRHNYHY